MNIKNYTDWLVENDFMEESRIQNATVSQFLFSSGRKGNCMDKTFDNSYNYFINKVLYPAVKEKSIDMDFALKMIEITSISEFLRKTIIRTLKINTAFPMEVSAVNMIISILAYNNSGELN